MLLLFSCPGAIRVASCPVSSRLISSTPTSSGTSVAPPLHPPYYGPYAVRPLRGPCTFTLQVRQREEKIAASRLKAFKAMDATPGSPRCRCRPPGPGVTATPATTHPGGPAASKPFLFSDPPVSPPSRQEQPRICLGTNQFSPTPQGGFCMPRAGSSFAASTKKGSTCSASRNCL